MLPFQGVYLGLAILDPRRCHWAELCWAFSPKNTALKGQYNLAQWQRPGGNE